MIKRTISSLIIFLISITLYGQTSSFQKSTPEEEGIPSEAITSFLNSLEKQVHSVHSFVLLRNGKLVAEGWWDPYKKQDAHTLFSISKSFTSAAVGFAVQEKLLDIDDKVISFFPNDLPENPSDNLKNMRLRDLLTMSTGHTQDALEVMAAPKDNNPSKAFLALPVEHKPGTFFLYNTGASYLLSIIVQKVTGKKLVDYLQPRLFDPLQITHPKWGESAQGVNWGGFGLSLATEDVAKFGQLYLQKGVWQGKRLLPEEWINQSTAKQVSNGDDPLGHWSQGYGFQFWRNQKYGFRADGAFGQFCFVLPEFNLVLAMTGGTPDTKGVMDVVSEKLLPFLKKQKIKENPAALAGLKTKLSQLTLASASGTGFSPTANRVFKNTYKMEDNELGIKSISFSVDKKIHKIVFETKNGKEEIVLGTGKWTPGETSLYGPVLSSTKVKQQIASSSSWLSDNTFEIDLSYIESETMIKLLLMFQGNELTINGERNVNFGPTKLASIKGTIAKAN